MANKDKKIDSRTTLDGWQNIYTRQGVQGVDKQLGTRFVKSVVLDEISLEELYRGDGWIRRIIDLPAGDMTREWFEVNGDTDGDIVRFLETIKARQNTMKALKLASTFGGSVVLIGIDDGSNLEDPVRENTIKKVEFLRVYDRFRVTWTTNNLYSDPEHPKFGTPELYDISPITQGTVEPFKVHETRLLIFDGVDVPDRTRDQNQGWGDSVIQAIFQDVSNLTGSYFATRNIVDDFIQTIIKIDNLQELIADGQDAVVKKRLEILDLGRHLIHTMMLDTREDYAKHASSVSGLSDLLVEFQKALSAVVGMPMTLLMGQSPGGLNATGESDIRQWYDKIASRQENELKPELEKLIRYIMLSREGPTKGREIEDWSIEFNPLWQPTQKEIVDTRKVQSEIDSSYINQGVLMPEEVRESRFGGDDYSIETGISEDFDMSGGREPEDDDDEDDDDDADPRRDQIALTGVTSKDSAHRHTFLIDTKGNGSTDTSRVRTPHKHKIVNFEVQPGGSDSHTHTVPHLEE